MSHYSFYEKLLPFVHRQNDPKGAIKAIVDGAQAEYDLLKEKAVGLPSLQDLDRVKGDFLAYLAYHVGLDLDAGDDLDLRREQVRAAVPVYKIKGTDLGYESLLRPLGFGVQVIHLFEDSPDGATKEESEVITGFNERLPGWHAASRIKIELSRLPEIEGLDIAGSAEGFLSTYLLHRILDKIKSVTPIHIDVGVTFIWEFSDSLLLEDNLAIAFNHADRLHLGSCCYHGKGAYIINQEYATKYDSGAIYDSGTDFYDMLSSFSLESMYDSLYAFYDTNYSYHWDYPEYTYDPFCPKTWKVCCYRGEENAFVIHRKGFVKASGIDLSTQDASEIVTSAMSYFLDLKHVEEGDFLTVKDSGDYRRIIEVVDNHTLRLNRPMAQTGTFEFEVVWIDSWHRRQAMHKESMDFTLPAYFRRVHPTYKVCYDIPGVFYDSEFYYDVTGQKRDGCGLESYSIEETSVVGTLSPMALEFLYQGGIPQGQEIDVYDISGADTKYLLPKTGSIVSITAEVVGQILMGSITILPTIAGVITSGLGIVLSPGIESGIENVEYGILQLSFGANVGIGVRAISSPDYQGSGSLYITLYAQII